MRALILLITAATISASVTTSASAVSCKELADQCFLRYKNQNNDFAVRDGKVACYHPERLAACKKTLVYDGPGGVRATADRP
jgi:hypothetical protein